MLSTNSINMQFILTCPNGKQIDMTSDMLQQMKGEVTRDDVEKRITYYKETNEKSNNSARVATVCSEQTKRTSSSTL